MEKITITLLWVAVAMLLYAYINNHFKYHSESYNYLDDRIHDDATPIQTKQRSKKGKIILCILIPTLVTAMLITFY